MTPEEAQSVRDHVAREREALLEVFAEAWKLANPHTEMPDWEYAPEIQFAEAERERFLDAAVWNDPTTQLTCVPSGATASSSAQEA